MSKTKRRGATPKIICMNLSPKYIPEWDGWSAVREILSNAIDAGNHFVTWLTNDKVMIESDGEIPIESMLLIGHGTKTTAGSTIGQFGEGLKMAALVAARSGSMTIRTGTSLVEFFLSPSEYSGKEDALHASISEGHHKVERTSIVLEIPGIPEIQETPEGTLHRTPSLKDKCRDKFLAESEPHAFSSEDHPGRLYSQGIFVTDKVDSKKLLLSWNVPKIPLDRDRRMVVDVGQIRNRIQEIFLSSLDVAEVELLLDQTAAVTFDVHALSTYLYFYESSRSDPKYQRILRIVENWFVKKHGRPDSKTVMVDAASADLYARRIKRAERAGYQLVLVGPIAYRMLSGYLPSLGELCLPLTEKTPSSEAVHLLSILRKFCDELDLKWTFSVVDDEDLANIDAEAHGEGHRLLISTRYFQPGRFNEALQHSFEKMRSACYYDVDNAMAKLAKIAFGE